MKALISFFLMAWLCTGTVWSAPKVKQSAFDGLRAQYLSLRNTDIDIERAPEWENLAQEFRDFAEKSSKSPDAARALQHAALLGEELFGRFGGKDRLETTARDYRAILDRYPKSAVAGDSLLHLGDLYREADEETTAVYYYKQAIAKFPTSEYATIAADKLRQGNKPRRKNDPADDKLIARGERPLILIDPGHGGEDYGAVGVGGLLEKDVTLAVSFELEKFLKDRMGAVVRLTRRKDAFIPLAERTALANDFEADLFISIHANASPHGNMSGTETYFLDNAGDKSAKLLADRENSSTRFEGPQADLQYILSDLIQNAKMEDSYILANSVQRSLVRHIDAVFGTARDLGVKRAPFYVLVGAHMPCALVEISFIDNPIDGKNLADRSYRKTVAQGIYVGIRGYFERTHHKS